MATDFVAGCVGGGAGVFVGHPFDTVKVRLQTQSVSNPIFKGTFDCFLSTVKKESLHGLYKGVTSPLYGWAATNAVLFGVQGNVRRRLKNPDSIESFFVSGAVGGAAQCVIVSPMELARIRLQMQGVGESYRSFHSHQHAYRGPVDCLWKLFQVEGVRGVYKGLGFTLMREIPSCGVYFASDEAARRYLNPDRSVEDPISVLLLGGGFAGVVSWLINYPVDVIKSRFQADGSNKYKSYAHCCRLSYEEVGWRLFTRGLASTLLRAFPANGAIFTGAELTRRLVSQDRAE